jgi:hypothetical protein
LLIRIPICQGDQRILLRLLLAVGQIENVADAQSRKLTLAKD